MLTVNTYIAPSPIHGIGLFAAEVIPKNTVVWEYNPLIDITLTEEAIQTLAFPSKEQIEKYSYFENTLQKYILCGDDARYFNHSYTPNCNDEERIHTIATKNIAIGEELTCDYSIVNGRFAIEDLDVI